MTIPEGKQPNPGCRTTLLSLELTTRCNSPCRHCFARAGAGAEASLAPASAQAACQEGYVIGYRHLHLTGGEPLLWPGLFDLLDLASALGYHSIFLNSNGLLMTEATAARLARYRCLSASVSLQGPQALHDAVRGAGTYRQAARGIACALAQGLPTSVFTVVGKALLARLTCFAAAVNEQFPSLERVTLIQLIRIKGASLDICRDLLDPGDVAGMVRSVSALNLCGIITHVLNNPLVNAAAELMQLPLVPRSLALCRPGKLMIRANGEMTLAHSTQESFGFYESGAIEEVLTSRPFQDAVEADRSTCSRCRFIDLCRRHEVRPTSQWPMEGQVEIPYCQQVLTHCEPSDDVPAASGTPVDARRLARMAGLR